MSARGRAARRELCRGRGCSRPRPGVRRQSCSRDCASCPRWASASVGSGSGGNEPPAAWGCLCRASEACAHFTSGDGAASPLRGARDHDLPGCDRGTETTSRSPRRVSLAETERLSPGRGQSRGRAVDAGYGGAAARDSGQPPHDPRTGPETGGESENAARVSGRRRPKTTKPAAFATGSGIVDVPQGSRSLLGREGWTSCPRWLRFA